MKLKNLLFFILFFLILACTERQEERAPLVIDFKKNISNEKNIQLSELASEIKYIPIDTAIIIQMINSLEVADDLVFAGIFPNGLLVYNMQGHFVRKIGGEGSGPAEYSYGSAFTLDKENRLVYLLDRNKILVYNFDGHFQKEIPLQEFGGSFQDIHFSGGMIYLFEYISFGFAKYDWLVINPEGKQVFAKYNAVPSFKSEIGGFGSAVLSNNELYYLNGVNDTLFVTKEKSVQPFALVNWSELGSAENEATNFNLLDMVKTKRFLFFRYYMKESFYTACYDTENNEIVFVSSAKSVNHRDEGPGIVNDIDNGFPFVPKFYFEKEDREFLGCYIYPYELKERVESDEFKNSTPKYPEKKKELEQLANSLDENDNPVLMLIKLKE